MEKEYNGLPMPRRVYAIAAVTLGITLSVLDGSIANVALPTIAEALQISSADSIWIVNAYQLSIMVSLLAFSALGEIYSYRRTCLMGICLFTLSSVACALSGTFPALIAARVIQGLGAAMMMSVNMTLIRLIYPKRYFGRGIGLNATFVAIASVAGPTLSAGILAAGDWPWLFLINLPIGIVAFALGIRSLPANIVRLSDRPYPVFDVVLNALFFGALMMAVEGFSHGFSLTMVVLLAGIVIVIGIYYLRRQLHQQYPLLPIDLLRRPVFSVSIITSMSSFAAQMLALVSLPFYMQQMLGYTAVHAGLLMTAWPVVVMVVAPVSGWLVERIHAGILGGIGLGVMVLGLVTLALLHGEPQPLDIIWRMMLCGMGFALFQTPNNKILMTSAPPQRNGSASGMLAMARLVGQTVGASLVAMMFTLFGTHGARYSLWLAALMALVGCVMSVSRTAMTLPADCKNSTVSGGPR